MKRIFYLLTLVLFFSIFVQSYAQISQGGVPASFPKANLLKPLPYTTMQYVDVAQLQAEDVMLDTMKSYPWRFGDNLYVDLSPQNSGVWDTLNNATKIWRLGIRSAGALTINLTFDKYVLPPGAKLFVYNSTKTNLIGAFTDFNNRADSVFATTLIKGDSVIVEYDEPGIVAFPGILHLWRVTHGYRNAFDYAKAFGGAGACQINVVCPTGVGWENEIRSVCMLVSGGNGFCSGALVNNTANNGVPYILTANHCYSTPSSWVFWFNWQSPTCTNPSSSPSYNSISGATLNARTTTSDFCLVQMSSTPPSNFSVYYAGWSRVTTAPSSGMGIHHPSADIKKISPAGQLTNYGSYDAGNGPADCWEVQWSGTACTEPGSSGSPIFNYNHHIVGQLYGGPSACGATSANMHDFYGRFCTSWTGDGTNTTRLSNWLDPGSLNPDSINGYDPNGANPPVANFSASPTTSCTGIIQFTDSTTGSPISWLWNFGDGDTSSVQNPSHSYTTSGTFTVTLIATNSVTSDTLIKTNYLTISLPASPTTTGASRCGTGTVTLTASGSGTLQWYNAATGGSLVNTGTSYTTPSLTTTTNYYVQDSVQGPTHHCAKADNTGGGGYTSTGNHYEIFDCYTPVTLVSVKIYGNTTAPGNKTIALLNSAGTTLQSTTVNVLSGLNTYTLNFSLPVATALRLQCEGTNVYRNNSGVTYPYTTAGFISVTGSSAGANYYYYFYDWIIAEPGCISARSIVTATINPTDTAGVSITANPTGAICSGSSVTFTAAPANGGTTPSYQWVKNGSNITGATNSTYSSTTLANNDVITCILASNAPCITGSPATSNAITMTVNSPSAVTVSIAANPSGAICSGTSVTFTATPTHGGTTPSYQWKNNGTNISGATNSTYTSGSLANNNIIKCVLTSNATCITGSPATSNAITMTVNTPVAASISIAAVPSTPVCTGTLVIFTATAVNGGTSPTYQWQVNGNNVGTNASTYSSSALNNGDTVTCTMTSNIACVTSNPATSNTLNMAVSSSMTAGVSITASPSTTVCTGTTVIFTATSVNSGTNPTYQWLLNGNTVGTNSSTYSSASLNTGDVVICIMTSSLSCATGNPATSNSLTINIASSLSAVVLISANPGINICAGASVTFTATPYNGGTPSYQWLINGSSVGTNNSTFSTASLANNDVVSCSMTSSETCVTNNPATSNLLTVILSPILPASVSIAANPTGSICSGTPVTLTATPTNGGTYPTYQWQLNGANIGGNGSVYVSSTLNNGDIVTCQMNSSLNCVTGNPATSNSYTAIVLQTPATPTITQSGDTLISSSPGGNQWYFHNTLGSFPLTGATGQTYIPLVTGYYFVIVTGTDGCVSDTSSMLYIVVVGIDEYTDTPVYIYPNPVTKYLNIDFTAGLSGNTEIEIINSIGQLVHKAGFENIGKGVIKSFDMSKLSKGIYFLRIKNEHLVHTEKLVLD